MVHAPSKFLPDRNNRRLFPGFVAFCVAGVGVALGFIGQARSWRWLTLLAFPVVAVGVLGGLVFILRGWWQIYRGDYGEPPNSEDS